MTGRHLCLLLILHIIRMSLVCHSYLIVCHWYVTRMSIVNRMSFLCHLNVLLCYSSTIYVYLYVTRTSLVCHSHVFVCHSFDTRMYSYAIRMSLVCTRTSLVCVFTMNLLNRYWDVITADAHQRQVFIAPKRTNQENRTRSIQLVHLVWKPLEKGKMQR